MQSIETFFAMGGYGAYIWSAYGVTTLVLGLVAIASVTGLRRAERTLAALEAQDGGRRRRRRGQSERGRSDGSS